MDERLSSARMAAANDAPVTISWINIILAVWVLISPFVLGFSDFPRALWNNVATGLAIGILAIIRTSLRQQQGWSWANVVLGIWLILSPFALVFLSGSRALWNNIILGVIITIIAWSNSASTVRATA